MDDDPASDKHPSGRLIISSLFFSRIATRPSGVLTGFILIDIGLTFGCPVGVMGQILTASSIVAMIMALLTSVLSVRFKQKSILIAGLILISMSAIGCYLAPNYPAMLLSYSLNGIGAVMVAPMTIALVGEHLPIEKRSNAIGLIVASTPILSVITGLTIGLITSMGWRLAYIFYVLPISILSLTSAIIGIPSANNGRKSSLGGGDFLEGFKEVFSNSSAIACLVGSTLSLAAWSGIVSYGISFYRQKFLMPTEWAGIIWSGMAFCFTLGSLFGGKFANKFGRKPLTLLSALLVGLFTVSYANIPLLWPSIILAHVTSIFAGMRQSASDSLTLEQVPGLRGTIMSLSSGAMRLGSALGSGVGGFALLQFGWGVLGIALGGMGVAASLIYYFFAVDPTKT